MGGKPLRPITFQSGTAAVPAPNFTMPTDAVKHIYYWHGRGTTRRALLATTDTICASCLTFPVLLPWGVCVGRGAQKKNGHTHYRTHDTTVPSPLTINPGYSDAFKECNPQKAHTTGCIVVKELKHIHATLEEKRQGGQQH